MKNKNRLIAFQKISLDDDWKVTFSNPSFWKRDGVRSVFTHVYAPDYAEIENAYKKAGKIVFRPEGATDKTQSVSYNQEKDATENPVEVDSEEDKQNAEDNADNSDNARHWSSLSWIEMRSLAAKYSDKPIRNKKIAEEVLKKAEAEGKI